jgi:hypothetical protein
LSHKKTGILFDAQTVDAIVDAVGQFETQIFDRFAISAYAAKFSAFNFRENLRNHVEACCKEFFKLDT